MEASLVDPPVVSQIAEWARQNPEYAAQILQRVQDNPSGGVHVYLPLNRRHASNSFGSSAFAQADATPI